MSSYQTTIGLEIHAELKTVTKMFCASKNDPDETRPNVNICPICMGHPGTLPVINREAVRHVLMVGSAVGGTLADFTEFDRKNYFYPDIPKGYQISQYKYPLVTGGSLRGVAITRIHLEEDTARSSHEHGEYSLVDFNRAGMPLMELVTEPVLHRAEDASAFARELQLLLRALGASDANMEKGQMRVEANVSVGKGGVLGTKVEVKNLNSFRSVERAIAFEVARQTEILESGGKIRQETRGWDDTAQKTFSQRAKEESHDYRYFPDPDLPKLWISKISSFQESELRKAMPELPWEKRRRLSERYELSSDTVEIFLQEEALGALFDSAAEILGGDQKKVRLLSNYLSSDVQGLLRADSSCRVENLTPQMIAALIEMIASESLSSRGAKDTLGVLLKEGGEPGEVAERLGLTQKNDQAFLEAIVQSVIEANPNAVNEYKGGKEASLQFLVGQGMKQSKGSANPQLLQQLFKSAL